ncbi:MAG: TonB-dependent receptor [Bacteroidota bacterium]|nr:TonB-dependent receptor [Bacteroidota bacterium]
MRDKVFAASGVVVLAVAVFYSTAAAASSNLGGYVRDSQTGEPLPGATVFLAGTSLGASTNLNGKYIVKNIPPGSYTVRATYIGYKNIEVTLRIQEGADAKQDFALEAVGVQGETVVVTAQAEGQNGAINQQLSAMQIKNVVSAARIQELPDANAAESVARLPGVSLLRTGGEGNQIVIRGLQPKYNAIMVDGVRISSSDSKDRSADLSMISPYSLQGIEVSKTVTADQDPDVLGGTVNFKMREAGEINRGIDLSLLAQGAYDGLSDAPNKYTNYKYVASVDDRFFDDHSLGVLAQADIERRNLSSNELGASYSPYKNNQTDYLINSLNLNYIPRDRQRTNGTFVADYKLPEGKITLMNFVSSGTTEIETRAESFVVLTGGGTPAKNHTYTSSYTKSTLNTIVNVLEIEQQLPFFHVDFKFSHTYSETKNPKDWTVTFTQFSDPGLTPFVNKADVDPQSVPRAATNDTSQTFLTTIQSNNSWARDRALTTSLALDAPINFSGAVSAVIKFGGKFRYQPRSYTYEQFDNHGTSFSSPSAKVVADMIANHFPSVAPYKGGQGIPIVPFLDPTFSYGTFLNGDYTMAEAMNYNMVSDMANFLQDNVETIREQNGAEGYARHVTASTTNNYRGFEHQSAAYVMGTVNIGEELTVVSGIRYQDFRTHYIAPQGVQGTFSYAIYNSYDTLVEKIHSYWLPDFSLRYKPFPWFDIRLSYSNTLAYPDYNAIVPRIDVAVGSISWNNPDLVPSRSKNYDLYLSFYHNTVGLFTVGGFLKQIDDLIYPYSFGASGAALWKYYPQRYIGTDTTLSGQIGSFTNNPYRVDDYGMELDWQTHFWYLPHPLDGLVLNINYTHIFSNAKYPLTYLPPARGATPRDTSFTAPLIDQPVNVVNLSAGYDYRGFSIRVSMLYQSDVYTGSAGSDFYLQLHSSTLASRRWDLSVKQDLPWLGFQLFGDLNNFTGVRDVSVIQAAAGVPKQMQSYGLSGDIGLRFHL